MTGVATALPLGLPSPGAALWFDIRPNLKRSAVIAGDMLSALGKRRDVAGKGRNENQDVALALAWLDAYDISALVALDAQNLTRLTLGHLVALAKAASLPLWLLHRPPRSDNFERILARAKAHPMRYSDVPQPSMRQPATGVRLGFGLDDASRIPFDRFRTTLEASTDSETYRAVEAHFGHTWAHCDDTLDRDGATIDVLANLVEWVTGTAPHDDALVIGIRALQLAAWHHDIYLKTDTPVLLCSSERQLVDPITIDEDLVGYRQPHRAIVVALAAQQVGILQMLALTLDDVAPDGLRLGAHRTVPLLDNTARAAKAQTDLRRRSGAEGKDKLLPLSDRAVSTALNQASLDFGICVHGRRADRHVHPRRWLSRLGITATALP
ncbi:hypothetical protein [Longivirga aurantiaca]|uniref:Uncharacterized protein n=1 Tax=Longivirga aurantiaca TaxID=1837743 RepID=A0ABW1T1J9_9ACTN